MNENSYDDLIIVGIGASAGGLEALQMFIRNLPIDTNMVYVIAQHLAPSQPTMLGVLLAKSTSLQVTEIIQNEIPKPNQIYICPPNKNLTIVDGHFKLTPPEKRAFPKPSINIFFSSLAKEKQEKAIGIIFSGTGSDGAEGIIAIKNAGGITIAQDERTAKYSSMPRAAIETGYVDIVLSPNKVSIELPNIVASPNILYKDQKTPKNLDRIYELLLEKTGTDFTDYKINTIQRRIERRMAVNKIDNLEEYIDYLEHSSKEIILLHKDLVVIVTSFFRDKEAFSSLNISVLPNIIKNKSDNETIRVWSIGCATGEEVFSIAISFNEALNRMGKNLKLQIFATDISEEAIARARRAIFTKEDISNIDEKIVKNYFVKKDGYYEISKLIRDMIIFSKHDLIKDPAFLKIDLISCRNLLIYFNNNLQKRIFAIFHHALSPNGYLFLGKSENPISLTNLFKTIDNRWKLFQKENVLNPPKLEYLAYYPKRYPRAFSSTTSTSHINDKKINLMEALSEQILSLFAKDGVIIDKDLNIVYIRGDVNKYLTYPTGKFNQDILSLIREDLRLDLRTIISKVKREEESLIKQKVKILNEDKSFRFLEISAILLQNSNLPNETIAILFNEDNESFNYHEVSLDNKTQIYELEHELILTKERLQTTIEELETSNEELQSTNEELQSSNEELQSTNEELETSNEELQSTNEELITVNDELELKTNELREINEDLENTLKTVEYGMILLDNKLKIKKFTPFSKELFNITIGDVGQIITTIESDVELPGLKKRILNVIDNSLEEKFEIVHNEKYFWFKIIPSSDEKGCVNGAILSFFDKSDLKAKEIELQEYKEHLEEKVKEKTKELNEINKTLEKRVEEEVFKRQEKEKILLQQSKMATMGEMIGAIAHQWRQPLNALGIIIQKINFLHKRGVLTDNEIVEIEKRAMKQIGFMSNTIDDFRNFFKPNKSQEVFNVKEKIKTTHEILAPQFKVHNIEMKILGDEFEILGYPNEFQQVILNIINNSKDAIIERQEKIEELKGEIIVEIEKFNPKGLITIIDNGGGIKEELVEKVFEPYFTTKDEGKGSGIGLYMSKMIIEENMSGKIDLKNFNDGIKISMELKVKT